MKFLKMVLAIEIEIVQPVPEDSPVGSMLEEVLADKEALADMEKEWRAQFGNQGTVKSYSINEIGVIEV